MVEIQKTVDGWFAKLQKEVTPKPGHFAAFFFFVLAIGSWIGLVVMQLYPNQAMLAVIFPALAGAISYYNRALAAGLFVLMLILIFCL